MNSIKSILLVALAMLSINSFGQSPEKINYQAIIRDVTGTVIQNQSVSIKIEILESTPSGTPAYEESHNVVTNNYGLVNLKIGTGAVISGVFSAINWGANPYFLKISVDPAGGSNYTLVGVSELVSVPYALHAKTVDNTDDADADPTNEIQTVTLVGTDVTLSNGGGTFTINDADSDPANEIQTVSQSGNLVTLSNGGGTLNVNDSDSDPTNEYNSSANLTGTNLSIVDGGGIISVDMSSLQDGVNDADADPTNEYVTGANLTGTNLNIIDGGGTTTVDMSSLQDGVNDADADPTNEYITGANLIGTNLNIIDGGGTTTVDMSSLVGGGDPSSTNELNSSANLTGTNLNIIDAGGTLTVDMSSLQDGVNDADADPTNELNTSANLTGTNLNIVDAGGTLTVDMSSLQDGVNDADADPTNEYNSSANLTGTNLNIIDAGGTITVDMSSLQDGVNDADADPTNELQTLSITGDQLSISSGNTITIPTQTLFVGMHYQGGIIVFVDSSGLHGLIVAENDIVGTYAFQPSGNSNVTAAQSYYDGQANTTALVPVMGASSAAGQCDSYVVGGFSDWFLPSQAEIQLVFQNAYVVGNLDLGAIYWTSTQTPGGFGFSAVSYYGTGSANGSTNPGTAYSVRAMRAF
jgi:hypothetical protein